MRYESRMHSKQTTARRKVAQSAEQSTKNTSETNVHDLWHTITDLQVFTSPKYRPYY